MQLLKNYENKQILHLVDLFYLILKLSRFILRDFSVR